MRSIDTLTRFRAGQAAAPALLLVLVTIIVIMPMGTFHGNTDTGTTGISILPANDGKSTSERIKEEREKAKKSRERQKQIKSGEYVTAELNSESAITVVKSGVTSRITGCLSTVLLHLSLSAPMISKHKQQPGQCASGLLSFWMICLTD